MILSNKRLLIGIDFSSTFSKTEDQNKSTEDQEEITTEINIMKKEKDRMIIEGREDIDKISIVINNMKVMKKDKEEIEEINRSIKIEMKIIGKKIRRKIRNIKKFMFKNYIFKLEIIVILSWLNQINFKFKN